MSGPAVADCISHNINTKGAEVVFHAFPCDASLQRFPYRNGAEKTLNIANARICYHHFEETNHVRFLSSDMQTLPWKRLFKSDAFPSCTLPCS